VADIDIYTESGFELHYQNNTMHIPTMSRDSRIKVTSGKSLYGPNDFQINEDEPLISFFNHCLPREPLSAKLPRCGNECSADRLSIDCGSLEIYFRRTVRVPESGKPNNLPPGLGAFSLYNVAEFSRVLPQDMVEKGGLFFAMYRKFCQFWLRLYHAYIAAGCRTGSDVVAVYKQQKIRYSDICWWRQWHYWRAYDSEHGYSA